jgi:hypothetical protein
LAFPGAVRFLAGLAIEREKRRYEKKLVLLLREEEEKDGGTELGWIIKSCDQPPVSAGKKATVQR